MNANLMTKALLGLSLVGTLLATVPAASADTAAIAPRTDTVYTGAVESSGVCAAGNCVEPHHGQVCVVAGRPPADTWTCVGPDGLCSRDFEAPGSAGAQQPWSEICVGRLYRNPGLVCYSTNADPDGDCLVEL